MARIESRTAELFRKKRRERDMDYREAAEKAGYQNIDKGMRRMKELEDKANYFPHPQIRERFAQALGISHDEIEGAMKKDFQALDQPVEPFLIIRIMAAVYVEHDLPEGCTREEAERIAEEISVQRDRKCCLVLSPIRGIYYEPDGNSHEEYSLPAGGIGSRGSEMHFQKTVDRFARTSEE